MCNWVIAVKRDSYAQALCAVSLLAATLQMAIWFMWNGSLYVVSLIYRLNQSKVYIWSNFCNFAEVRLYGYATTLLLPKAKRAFLCAFLFWPAMITLMILLSANHWVLFEGRHSSINRWNFQQNHKMQPTETKETIGNKENAKMLFLRYFVSVLFLTTWLQYNIS